MLPEETINADLHLSPEKQQGFINALLENVEDGIVACDSGASSRSSTTRREGCTASPKVP
jgi:hypothetical protein